MIGEYAMERAIRNAGKALIIKDGKMLAIKLKDEKEEWYNYIWWFPKNIISFNFSYDSLVYCYLLLGLVTYLNYFVVMTANVINKPIEKCVYLYYKNKALKKLKMQL